MDKMSYLRKLLLLIHKNYLESLSVVIAICALFLTIYQARINDYHNRLSVVPIIDIRVSTTEENSFRLSIENKGTGTAIVTNIEYNESQINDFGNFFYDDMKELGIDIKHFKNSKYREFTILNLSPGENEVLYEVNFPKKQKNSKELNKKIDTFIDRLNKKSLIVCFRSVYKDQFFVSINTKTTGYHDGSCAYEGKYKLFGRLWEFHWLWEVKIPRDVIYPVIN